MTEAYLTPISVRVEEVVLVQIWRGGGDLFRPVLRVYSKSGEFLAEHDGVHRDPEYASYYLRDHARHDWLVQQEREPDPAQAKQEVAHG